MSKRRKRKSKVNLQQAIVSMLILLCVGIVGYFNANREENYSNISEDNTMQKVSSQSVMMQNTSFDIAEIPAYTNQPYIVINDNQPNFKEEEMTTTSFENYAKLDSLGRCGVAYSCVGIETMPTEKRGDISQIKPTGWHTTKYDIVDGKYLYNRCHLIGYQLTAENANKKNLITGTRYMNVEGMLPFENQVAEYIEDTNHHVLYRVTPIFERDNLIASGVQMEAKSVEDNGKGVCFNIYVYNVQPGVTIDYATGESKLTK